MRVDQLMTGTPASCRLFTNLGEAVELMLSYNCGILPVLDAHEAVLGVVTDRDICIALGTRNKLPGEITVGEVATRRAVCCKPGDDVRTALAAMAEARVRRLPVVDNAGKLVGVLSMDDIVMRARGATRPVAVAAEDVLRILNSVYRPDLPVVVH
ncbi:MAG TPA: CBS domain-containing protein [Candidatus Aquilonibacter sp.]|nr:CBS domain-containing protein [Candidatus Aquilonibacter sp.]